MDLTDSWRRVWPESVQARYEFAEVRNASAVLAASNPDRFTEIVAALDGFILTTTDLIDSGGNESALAHRLNNSFRVLGWRESAVDTRIALDLSVRPFREAGETERTTVTTEVANAGYQVDNMRGRVALDLEWNAKEGHFDRDVVAYRALYELGLIDCAVLISRTQSDLRPLAQRLAQEIGGMSVADARKRLGTTTSTNADKLIPRMTRGDLGGCPLVAVFICARTWNGAT